MVEFWDMSAEKTGFKAYPANVLEKLAALPPAELQRLSEPVRLEWGTQAKEIFTLLKDQRILAAIASKNPDGAANVEFVLLRGPRHDRQVLAGYEQPEETVWLKITREEYGAFKANLLAVRNFTRKCTKHGWSYIKPSVQDRLLKEYPDYTSHFVESFNEIAQQGWNIRLERVLGEELLAQAHGPQLAGVLADLETIQEKIKKYPESTAVPTASSTGPAHNLYSSNFED